MTTIPELLAARFRLAASALTFHRAAPPDRRYQWAVLQLRLGGAHVGWILRHYLREHVYLITTAPESVDGQPGYQRSVWRSQPHDRLWIEPERATGQFDAEAVLTALLALDLSIDLPST